MTCRAEHSIDAFPAAIAYLGGMALLGITELLSEAKTRGLRTALLLTALDLELQAVLAHLVNAKSVVGRDGTIYECGIFREGGQEWLVVLIETGACCAKCGYELTHPALA